MSHNSLSICGFLDAGLGDRSSEFTRAFQTPSGLGRFGWLGLPGLGWLGMKGCGDRLCWLSLARPGWAGLTGQVFFKQKKTQGNLYLYYKVEKSSKQILSFKNRRMWSMQKHRQCERYHGIMEISQAFNVVVAVASGGLFSQKGDFFFGTPPTNTKRRQPYT